MTKQDILNKYKISTSKITVDEVEYNIKKLTIAQRDKINKILFKDSDISIINSKDSKDSKDDKDDKDDDIQEDNKEPDNTTDSKVSLNMNDFNEAKKLTILYSVVDDDGLPLFSEQTLNSLSSDFPTEKLYGKINDLQNPKK